MTTPSESDSSKIVTKQTSHENSEDLAVQALYEVTRHLADMQRGTQRLMTRDLVALLLSHGARTWRNTKPKTLVRIKVSLPEGKPALRLSLYRVKMSKP